MKTKSAAPVKGTADSFRVRIAAKGSIAGPIAIASGLGKSLGRIYNIRSGIKKKTNNDPLALDVLNGTHKPSNPM